MAKVTLLHQRPKRGPLFHKTQKQANAIQRQANAIQTEILLAIARIADSAEGLDLGIGRPMILELLDKPYSQVLTPGKGILEKVEKSDTIGEIIKTRRDQWLKGPQEIIMWAHFSKRSECGFVTANHLCKKTCLEPDSRMVEVRDLMEKIPISHQYDKASLTVGEAAKCLFSEDWSWDFVPVFNEEHEPYEVIWRKDICSKILNSVLP